MPLESAISLKNRTDPHQAKQNNRNRLVPRGSQQRKNCWKPKDNTEFIDTMVDGWSCPPIYIIQRAPEDDNDDDDDEEIMEDRIFDGAHKFEAAAFFIDNKYPIEKTECLSCLKDHVGKYFKELPKAIRDKILNYEFNINYIDHNTAHDADALGILWKRLNKGGQKLNDYELSIPVMSRLIKNVLEPSSKQFFGSEIYPKEETRRGQLEKILQMILAISESNMADYASLFNSKKHLIKLWQDTRLGKKNDEINKRIDENQEKWLEVLKKACQYLKVLSENNCFTNQEEESILQAAHRSIELVFLLGRLITHFPKPEEFRRLAPKIAKAMKDAYLVGDLQRDKAGRNGGTQRRILKEIDALVYDFTKLNCPRSFTKEQVALKFKEQDGKCALCKNAITKVQTPVGDHIIPWSLGGTSETSNCQVVHEPCNLGKSNRIDRNHTLG